MSRATWSIRGQPRCDTPHGNPLTGKQSIKYNNSYGHSLWHALLSIVSAVVVDFLLIGLAISSTCW